MKRILVIDDDQNLLSDLIEILGYEGYDALGANSGQEGLTLAREQIPDLIVCDITMPDLDGFGVITALRQEEQTTNIPVIFLSARNEQSFVQSGLRLGAIAYVPKPYNVKDLLATIRDEIGS